jgi:hypothetical protein
VEVRGHLRPRRAGGILMPTRTQGRGGRGRRQFGHSPPHLLLRPRRDSASDVAICGTSPSLQRRSPFLPSSFPPKKRNRSSEYTDPTSTIGASLGAYRGLGWRVRKGSKGSGISDLCRHPLHLSATICWYVDACRVRMRCGVTWLPLWGSVALRLACKIRLQLTEGSRVHPY